MIRKLFALLGLAVALLAAYLLLWPVPIDPQSWDAPANPGYTGLHAENSALADMERLEMGEEGPEDIEIRDGLLYASSQTGKILTYDLATDTVREFADTGGLPLGLEFDRKGRLLIADAAKGLLRVNADGEVETLLAEFGGAPILYADDVDQAPDGTLCFSDASTKFGAVASGGTMEGSLLEIMEHGATGRILCTGPDGEDPYELIGGLSFPNGTAFTPDGDLLVNITGTYETLRVSPDGTATRFAGPYPGFPDNINLGPVLDGEATYIVGLVSPRSEQLDAMAGRPTLRKIVQRLPESMRPSAVPYAHLVVLGADGRVIADYQDPSGDYASVTGGQATPSHLYLSSLTEHAVARIPLPETLKE